MKKMAIEFQIIKQNGGLICVNADFIEYDPNELHVTLMNEVIPILKYEVNGIPHQIMLSNVEDFIISSEIKELSYISNLYENIAAYIYGEKK